MTNDIEDIKEINCVLCGVEIEGFGNNPSPIKEEGECCDNCNIHIVIPQRMKRIFERGVEEGEKVHEAFNKKESEELPKESRRDQQEREFLGWCERNSSRFAQKSDIQYRKEWYENIYQRGRIDAQNDIRKQIEEQLKAQINSLLE